jgi:hypothetical protein
MYWKNHPAHKLYCEARRPKSETIKISNGKPKTLAVYYYACATEAKHATSAMIERMLELAAKFTEEAEYEDSPMVRELP